MFREFAATQHRNMAAAGASTHQLLSFSAPQFLSSSLPDKQVYFYQKYYASEFLEMTIMTTSKLHFIKRMLLLHKSATRVIIRQKDIATKLA